VGLKAQKWVLSSKNKECYVVLTHAYLYFYESYVSYMANAAELQCVCVCVRAHTHTVTHRVTHTLSPTHTFPTTIRVHKYTDDIFYYKAYREDPDASFNGTILSTKG
jgi:hypothetical protein